jgi:hypothetical protein
MNSIKSVQVHKHMNVWVQSVSQHNSNVNGKIHLNVQTVNQHNIVRADVTNHFSHNAQLATADCQAKACLSTADVFPGTTWLEAGRARSVVAESQRGAFTLLSATNRQVETGASPFTHQAGAHHMCPPKRFGFPK